MDDTELSELQRDECEALLLNRAAVIRVVSSLRKYREAVKTMLGRRYSDGEVDGATLSMFADTIDEIENPPEEHT